MLENHRCETCPELLVIFKPYKASSNAEYQQTWHQKNKEKCAKHNKPLYQIFVVTLLQTCLKRLVVGFVEN
jgi:hypothetical protein